MVPPPSAIQWGGNMRTWVPELPRSAWIALAADSLSALGSGLTLPFMMVYLHSVRGLSLSVSGMATACVALAGLLGNPIGGACVDRWGPRRVLAAGWAVAAGGACFLAVVSQPWEAFGAAAISGLGAAVAWPAQDALLAQLVPAEKRSGAFALRHTTLNLGLAFGSLTAAQLADSSEPSSFMLLYYIDGATFVLAIILLLGVRIPSPATPDVEARGKRDTIDQRYGYSTVVKDQAFIRLWLLLAVLVATGFSQVYSTFPIYVTEAGLGSDVVGMSFAANTVTVTVMQLIVLRMVRGRRRTTAISALSAIWALSWILVLVSGLTENKGAVLLFILAAIMFGLGETLFAPSVPPLVSAMAPDGLLGRYNGASAFAFTVGFAAGPALAGILLQKSLDTVLLAVLICGCAVAALLARSLRRRIGSEIDVIDSPGDQATDIDQAVKASAG
ncbi:MFS transporter [Streptomyces bobili]|uniref:MFS transporter n=1 Tax=Streptomyces bobili TaxID=67280 RepID=UPI003826FF76